MNFPAQKLEIIAPKEKSEEILEKLQLQEIIQIISLEEEKKESELKEKLDLLLAEMKFVRSFLFNFKEKEGFLKSLIDSFAPEKKKYKLEELINLSNSPTIKEFVEECQKIETELNRISSRRESLKREIKELSKFSGISLINLEELDNFNIFIGSIKSDRKEELLNNLKEESIFFYIEWGGEEEMKEKGFYVIYPKEEDKFPEIMESTGAKREELFWNRSPKDLLEEKREELKELTKKEEKAKEKAKELAKELYKFEALSDFYTWEMEKIEALEKGIETRNYFCLRVWLKGGEGEKLNNILKEITPYFLIEEVEIEEGESPPVFIENQGLMQSFEVVTGVYGAPKSDEPDPTPFLAPFFAVAFGLALSDAGYGLLLLIFSFLMKRKLEGAKNFFNLFIISGAFTIIAGILTGTVFGTEVFQGLRIVDPMDDPIEVLLLVSVLGIIQIFVGILIGFFWNLKEGEKEIALGDKGGALAFFLGLGLFFLTGEMAVLIASIILMMGLNIIFSKNKGLISRLSGGFGSLYNLIGYFSDVLSYSRLLALGLATGIIAMTINMIAEISMEMIPVAGLNFALAGIILVFGHSANLGINALSSFIHSARLQFVEFFSKFMEGGGEKIKPLSKQGRFVEIIK